MQAKDAHVSEEVVAKMLACAHREAVKLLPAQAALAASNGATKRQDAIVVQVLSAPCCCHTVAVRHIIIQHDIQSAVYGLANGQC